MWKISKLGQIKTRQQDLHIHKTTLLGSIDINNSLQPTVCNVSINSRNKQVQQFWEIDERPTDKGTNNPKQKLKQINRRY